MHSLRTTCAGPIFALAKPHDSAGKRTRNRIPKEERKTLVASFIKKHQSLNNGSFPSLSLTHKEVGGSFYTIREIVREIIQENRVLGTTDLVLEGKGDDHLQDQTLSSSVLLDHVPPLSLSPHGYFFVSDNKSRDFSSVAGETKSHENDEKINGSQASVEDRVTDILNCSEDNDTKHDAGLHDSVKTICDSFAVKSQDKELNDRGFEEIPFIESEGTKPINNDERASYTVAAMTEMVSMAKNTVVTINVLTETVVETFPIRSVTSTMESSDVQPSELVKVCEGGKGTEEKVETDSSNITSVDLEDISSSTSALHEEQGTEVIVRQIPNHISVPLGKKFEEKIVDSVAVDVECADTKGTVVVNDVIGNIHETKEYSNGSLTTETIPTFGTEFGSCKNDVARSVEKATVKKWKLDASDSSSSEKGNIPTLNRIKPESWNGQSNVAGQDTNPFLAVLKSFLTAFVKFWSE